MTAAMTFAERADRLKKIDAEINGPHLMFKRLQALVREEEELLSEPFDVCKSENGLGILIDRDTAIAEIHDFYEALTPRHILHGLARGGEFQTKTATYKAAE